MTLELFKIWKINEDGSTAMEFSLLAVPFMFTVISLIELALFFTTSMILENAVQDSSRLIKTGSLQQSGGTPLDEFLEEVCNEGGIFLDCDAIQYQVDQLTSFEDDIEPVVNEDGDMDPSDLFNISDVTAGCIALVRLSYPFTFITPVYSNLWSNYNDGVRVIMSTVVFQVEPYDFEVTDPNCSVDS